VKIFEGEKKMNSNEKRFTEHESQITNHDSSEPSWIRDSQIIEIQLSPADPAKFLKMVAEICEGENSFCEHCGEKFPMWPTKAWADHLITEHGPNLTIQVRTGTAAMCQDEIGPAQQVFFSMMFGSRVSMRRRAWKLGYARTIPTREDGRSN
jgi:hypothetical protein